MATRAMPEAGEDNSQETQSRHHREHFCASILRWTADPRSLLCCCRGDQEEYALLTVSCAEANEERREREERERKVRE